jgi:RND family efflux transporter MFP subunit
MRRNTLLISFFSIIIIGLILWYNKQDMKQQAELSERKVEAIPVTVKRIVPEPLPIMVESAGILKASEEVMVMSQTQGTVTGVHVRIGSRIGKDQVIARVESDLNNTEVAVNKAAYEKARKDYERAMRLAEGDAITAQQLEGLELQVEAAEARLQGARKKLNNTTITAPFSGTVNQVFVKKGGTLGPGVPVCEIVDISKLLLTVKVSEQDVLRITVGDTAAVTLDTYPDRAFAGNVTGVAQKADYSLLYSVEMELLNMDDLKLRAGMFARVQFRIGDPDSGAVIPRRAIIGSIKAPYVFVVEEGLAHRKSVVIAYQYGDQVKLASGLDPGDLVVVAGQQNLLDGTKVKVID